MRSVVWFLMLTACTTGDTKPDDTDAPDTDTTLDTEVVDTAVSDKPRCGDLGEGCEALPVRGSAWICGPAFFEGGATGDLSTVVWPATLTATGCFTGFDPIVPTEDLVRYDVRAPLWSDNADKDRWMAVPPGERIGVTASGEWLFPNGSVLLKSFALRSVDADPNTSQLLEMRVMVRVNDGWSFATYILNDEVTEGTLNRDRGSFRTFPVQGADGTVDVDWWYPSASGCITCHRDLAEEALGTRTVQLNRVVDYGDMVANQLVALEAAGWLEGAPETLTGLPRMVNPYDPRQPAEQRARAWLHGQCAHCHAPGGFVPPELVMDLRHDTPLAGMNVCNEPRQGGVDVPAEVVVAPGHAADSLLIQRARMPGVDRMPAGTNRLDEAGLQAVEAWIDGLADCP